MKSLAIFVLILFVFLHAAPEALAGRKQNPQSFNAFWTRFKSAIARDDKEAVASMTKLPFLFDSEERSREGFIKIYNQLFTRSVKRCFSRARPLKEGDMYEIFCGETIFLFAKVDGQWRFTEIGAND